MMDEKGKKKKDKGLAKKFENRIVKLEKAGHSRIKLNYIQFQNIIRDIKAVDKDFLFYLPDDLFLLYLDAVSWYEQHQPKGDQKIKSNHELLEIPETESRHSEEEIDEMYRILGLDKL